MMFRSPYGYIDDFEYVSLSEFDTLVLPFVAGVPYALYQQELRRTLDRFTRRTGILRGFHNPVVVSSSQTVYDFTGFPDDMAPINLLLLYQEGSEVPLNAKTYDVSIDRRSINLRLGLENSLDGKSLYALFNLRYLPSATSTERKLFEDWSEPISAGTKARLFEMAGRPWFNPQLSTLEHQRFTHGISSAKAAASRFGSFVAPVLREPFE